MVLDVGTYDALLLGSVAPEHPDTLFVGLDWKARPLYLAAERLREKGVENVRLLQASAQAIERMFGPGELDEIWVFHPEPFDNGKEKGQRLLTLAYVTALTRLLRPGGSVVIKTDHPGYARDIAEVAKHFTVREHSSDLHRDEALLKRLRDRLFGATLTTFEARHRRRGNAIAYWELSGKGQA